MQEYYDWEDENYYDDWDNGNYQLNSRYNPSINNNDERFNLNKIKHPKTFRTKDQLFEELTLRPIRKLKNLKEIKISRSFKPFIRKKILLLGEFSSGKTAFINMLLGYPVLPEKIISTDLPVVEVSKGKKSGIFIKNKYGKSVPIDSWEKTSQKWNDLNSITVSIKGHPLLEKGIVIYDTPGINTTNVHHLKHIENFLNNNRKDYQLVLYFIPDKLSKTSLDFLTKWKSKFKSIILVANIKDVKTEEESRQIEKEIKRISLTELGSIPVHLLSIGDIYDLFYEEYENADDWRTLTDWDEKVNFFNNLIGEKLSSIIGEDLFEIIWSIARKDKEIHDYSELSDTLLSELSEYDDSNAILEKAKRLINSSQYSQAAPLLQKASELEHPEAQNLLGLFYQHGIKVKKDKTKAITLYQKAIQSENDEAMLNLGLYYINNKPGHRNKALELITNSAKLGNERAGFYLGLLKLHENFSGSMSNRVGN